MKLSVDETETETSIKLVIESKGKEASIINAWFALRGVPSIAQLAERETVEG